MAGPFDPLVLYRKTLSALADDSGSFTRPLGQQGADAFIVADFFENFDHGIGVAKP